MAEQRFIDEARAVSLTQQEVETFLAKQGIRWTSIDMPGKRSAYLEVRTDTSVRLMQLEATAAAFGDPDLMFTASVANSGELIILIRAQKKPGKQAKKK